MINGNKIKSAHRSWQLYYFTLNTLTTREAIKTYLLFTFQLFSLEKSTSSLSINLTRDIPKSSTSEYSCNHVSNRHGATTYNVSARSLWSCKVSKKYSPAFLSIALEHNAHCVSASYLIPFIQHIHDTKVVVSVQMWHEHEFQVAEAGLEPVNALEAQYLAISTFASIEENVAMARNLDKGGANWDLKLAVSEAESYQSHPQMNDGRKYHSDTSTGSPPPSQASSRLRRPPASPSSRPPSQSLQFPPSLPLQSSDILSSLQGSWPPRCSRRGGWTAAAAWIGPAWTPARDGTGASSRAGQCGWGDQELWQDGGGQQVKGKDTKKTSGDMVFTGF